MFELELDPEGGWGAGNKGHWHNWGNLNKDWILDPIELMLIFLRVVIVSCLPHLYSLCVLKNLSEMPWCLKLPNVSAERKCFRYIKMKQMWQMLTAGELRGTTNFIIPSAFL